MKICWIAAAIGLTLAAAAAVAVTPAETHGSAEGGAAEAAVSRRPGARLRGVFRAQPVAASQGAQSGGGEGRRQPGPPLQRGTAIIINPPPPTPHTTTTSSSSPQLHPPPHLSPHMRLPLTLINLSFKEKEKKRLDGFWAQASTLSIFVCKDGIWERREHEEPESGASDEMNSELCYALIKNSHKTFYLLEECKHFVLLSFPIVK